MFRKLKHLTKELLVFLVIFSMVCWSVSLPLTHFIKNTKAAGGIELMSIDDGGSTPDVYLDSLNTPEAFLKIAIYETETGTNTLDSVTVQLDQAMNCSGAICDVSPFDAEVDLGSLSNASTSGISLWLDNGDGNFDSSADTLISATPSAWAILNNPCPPPDSLNNTLWQTTFSNLNLTIPALFASRLTVFVAASAAANLDASTLHKFMPIITQNGIDISTTATNPSISDFPSETCGWMFMPVTLGTEGGGGGDSAPLVISEIQTSGAGVNDECIEIYNRTDQTVNTSGIVLGYIASTTSSLSAWSATSTLDINIPAYSYYLIGKSGGVYDGGGADETYTEFSLDETGGFVGLIHPEYGIIDMVGYGALASPFLAEGASPAPAPSAGGSIERKAYPSSSPSTMIGGVDSARGNASDTNNNSADFILRDPSDPQNASSDPESDMMLTTERGIVLNEVLYNTASGDGWIEIYNASTTKDIVLTDYVVEIATTTATSTAHIYTIPALTLSSGGFALIEWNESGGTDDTDSSDGLATLYAESKLNMSTLGGDITLWNDSGAIVDYIQYGGSGKYNQANAVAAGKWASGDFIPGSNYNASIARQGTAGDDYDDSIDWMPMSSPSAGYPNTGGDSTAPTAVTNVVLTDSDVSNYGLNGLDIRVSWSPASANDSSFDRYALYILPNGTSLDTNQHTSLANLYGQYYYESGTASTSYAFTGGSGMLYDSAGNALGTGSYQAHVVAIDFSGNRSSAVSSPVATLTGEGAGEAGADTVDPMIDHMNIWEARAESDITLYARMGDDRDQCAIATSSIIWKIGNDAWANATTTACVLPAMIGNVCLRECTVSWPASGWDADTTIYYYLAAYDQAGNSTFLGMYPTTNETEARNSVYVDSVNNNSGIDFIATADWDDDGTVADISGTVLNESGTPLQDAFVMIEGVAAATATTTANGAFTFADNAIRHPWAEIKVLKSGYMSEMRSVARDSSGIEIRLFTGDMSVSTAGGNGIAWTAPMDGMMMSPINIACSGDCSTVPMPMAEMPIIISFFNQMDSSTINDTDASNAGSNIYVTSDGNTKIPGSVKYVYNESYGTSEARFYSSTNLSYNTFYMVVLTPNVNDINGNPIESNRTSGNYEFSFSTMADGTTMWDGGYTDFADGGMYMPPYVIGTNPTPGSYNIPLGAILTVKFSEPMDPTSISSAVTLYPPVSGTTISLDSATKQVATISHIDALAANTTYEIRVMGSAKSQLGVWMGDPSACGIVSPDACLANTTHYTTSFQTSAVNDETAPTISGSYPANNDGITNSSVVDVAVPSMEIGFSEAMNPSTITSQSITLKKGTVSIAGSANYDPMSNSAKFSPSSALTANSVYTLTASTSITDLSGNRLNISSGNNIINFKTGSSDTLNPEVLYANGDDYQIAITFSE
ncbi:Ig-like domain-containing protein, partial [Patescibacteria group bacterium]|nr:Ig-like domain-containing protein [Patescibacteria group bacterium]